MAQSIDNLLHKARAAQQVIENWPQDRVDEMVAAVAWETYKQAKEIARLAIDETQMGVYEHKVLKHEKKTLGVMRDMQGVKTTGVIEEYSEMGLIKFAKPIGVIGALIPVTNCEATLPANALPALKCRNAIIFAPHPRAKKTAVLVTVACVKDWRKLEHPWIWSRPLRNLPSSSLQS